MSEQPSQTTFAKDQLKSIIERIERLEEEKKQTSDDIREVYAEAKGNGFDVTALKTIVKMRKQDVDTRREQEAVLETYMHALGMLVGLPLGDHALARAAKKTTTAQTTDDDKVTLTTAAGTRTIRKDEIGAVVKEEMGAIFDKATRRAARSPRVRSALKKMGEPVELTAEERAKGYTAAFIKNGTRMTIGMTGDGAGT